MRKRILLIILATLLLSGCGKKSKLTDFLETEKNWYGMSGYLVFTFEDGTCTIVSQGTGGDTYQTGYEVYKFNDTYRLRLLDEQGNHLYGYEIVMDEETGEIKSLESSSHNSFEQYSLSLHPGEAETKLTFLEENEAIIEESILESEESLNSENPQSPSTRYDLNTSVLEEQIDATRVFLQYITGKTQAEIVLPTPEPVVDTLYLSPDLYPFEPLDYDTVQQNMMNFTNSGEFLSYLKSTTWMYHDVILAENTHEFNDGYVDISYRESLSSVWITFNQNTMKFNLGNIITNELRDSSEYRYSIEPVGDSFVCLVGSSSFSYTGETDYMGKTYGIDFMFFVNENGLLNQTMVLYGDDEYFPFSSSNIYADGNTVIWDYFEPRQYDDPEAFSNIVLENNWVLDEFQPLYEVDLYVADFEIPELADELSFDEEFVGLYNTGDLALFAPQNEVEFNNIEYSSGLYYVMDSEDHLVVRLALYDEDRDEFRFTSNSWLFNMVEPEAE